MSAPLSSSVTKADRRWLWGVVGLWLLVIVSSLAVIASTHVSRKRLHELEVLRRETEQLHVAWGQYLLERSAWGAYSRVEQEARKKLEMHTPTEDELIMVTP